MKIRKKRKKSRSMVVLYVGIIISVNLIGLGYGNWSTTINYNNTMSTGSVDTAFVCYDISEYSDKHNMSMDMNIEMTDGIVDMCKLSEASFEIINYGTLPVAINYDTFQPVSEVNIAGLPMKVNVYLDGGPGKQYVFPGKRFYGRVSIEILNEINSNYHMDNVSTNLPSTESIVVPLNSDSKEEETTMGCNKEVQSVPILIPIGLGVWEDTLVLNVNLNVNIKTTKKEPKQDNINIDYNNNSENQNYITLPSTVTEGNANSLETQETENVQTGEQSEQLSTSTDKDTNNSMINEKETDCVTENEQSNVESSGVNDSENLANENPLN